MVIAIVNLTTFGPFLHTCGTMACALCMYTTVIRVLVYTMYYVASAVRVHFERLLFVTDFRCATRSMNYIQSLVPGLTIGYSQAADVLQLSGIVSKLLVEREC